MVLLGLGVLLVWSVCTLIRLSLEWLSNVLPYRNQMAARIALVTAVTAFSYWLFTVTSFVITNVNNHFHMGDKSYSFLIAIMIDVLALIVLNLINIFLFKKFAETKK